MELIPNCSLLNLHSNDMNSLKNIFKKKVIAINIILAESHKSAVNWLLNIATNTSQWSTGY